MEVPRYLQDLYRHWKQHAERQKNPIGEHGDALPEHLPWFVEERMHMLEKKLSGSTAPHSNDPVLLKYRFCNIFREFDRQTISFHTLLNPLRNDFPLWLLNMFYVRLVARTETVQEVGLLSFDPKENEQFYAKLIASPRPRFGTPYVFPVSTILKSVTPTRELFLAHFAPSVMKDVAQEIASWKEVSVQEGLPRVLQIFGFNLSFLWTEVLIDVAYQYPERIDLFGTFPVGPGSLPTIHRIDPHEDPGKVVEQLAEQGMTAGLTLDGMSVRLSAENWEGIGCEFRKYTNLSKGVGRKRIYTPFSS